MKLMNRTYHKYLKISFLVMKEGRILLQHVLPNNHYLLIIKFVLDYANYLLIINFVIDYAMIIIVILSLL